MSRSTTRRYSNRTRPKFGKQGRPPNDPVHERLRIYRAARRLILTKGVRGTTIKDVASVAYISPGGIYHYFQSKQHLLLYGLHPEALSRACQEEAAELYGELAHPSPDITEVVRLYVEKNVRMLEFVRPALQAAIELGRPALKRTLSVGLKRDADSLVTALTGLQCRPVDPDDAADAIRRTVLGLALDESVTQLEMRRRLEWLFQHLLPMASQG